VINQKIGSMAIIVSIISTLIHLNCIRIAPGKAIKITGESDSQANDINTYV